ncbi:MAG: SPOR domain-containing protein [Actinomycetota bacterium]|nr:SPOR domain-containing protein [Actinomycetota bacterium]
MPLSPARSFSRAGSACPTCGAAAEEDQLVCLECGSRVALDYRRPPSWRVPVAIIAAVVLLVGAAGVLALNAIGEDAEREAGRTPIKVKGAGDKTKKQAGASDGLVKRGSLYGWPREGGGFTVVLLRTDDRANADEFARTASKGEPAKIGVIRTDDFENLEKGFFLVFAGRYENRERAERAADRLGGRFNDAFAQAVER